MKHPKPTVPNPAQQLQQEQLYQTLYKKYPEVGACCEWGRGGAWLGRSAAFVPPTLAQLLCTLTAARGMPQPTVQFACQPPGMHPALTSLPGICS